VRDLHRNHTETGQKAADAAIRHIGKNALPYLLKWIRYELPDSKNKLFVRVNTMMRRIDPSLQFPFYRSENRADASVRAFNALGSEAKAAIPELIRLMNDPKADNGATRAADALGYLGKDALPPLLAILTNQQHRVRFQAVLSIGKMGTNALPAVPTLIHCLADSNQRLAGNALIALDSLKLEPDLVVPALVNALRDSRVEVRYFSAFDLANLGDKARSAVPALLELLNDPDRYVRLSATNALREIAPDAIEKASSE
jgi:HEAT repeat protein